MEYKVVRTTSSRLESKLNESAEEGFKVTSHVFVQPFSIYPHEHVVVMEREYQYKTPTQD